MSLKNEADGVFRNELNEYQGILFIQAFPQASGTEHATVSLHAYLK